MAGGVDLPVVDLASQDLRAAAASVRQACVEHGFFYVTNHGVDGALIEAVFAESKGFFDLPMEEKMKLQRRNHRGYTPPYAEKLDASSEFVGDLKESFYIGPIGDSDLQNDLNQWPSEECFPSWKETMKSYIATVLDTGKRILSLIALGLDLDAEFFHKIGALDCPSTFLRLLHYPGSSTPFRCEVNESDSGNYGASAHSDYGAITLLVTDGTPGLQICREKGRDPQLWEDVHHIDGAFIVNIGDLLERWTNCVFRSTLHRVVAVGKERYSVAFFLDPNYDTVVQCIESCCSEADPPRFPPIRSGEYINGRINSTYK
ncbi:2-oxoglutarate-Fe(II) type oxidoreductase hxnY-like isoform X1 [Panicum hallii]|uniref:2-oxoglutarate-Fe(II) type oxidoreductase hxnY-like isoform X1 n=1 Tax=Panicum hallii TaxID=206008 RepID=UPI000DF4E0FD|nr:2-oxoglutarate-Fe(II) type oxidoreductase hxnY-like isoform X1 [Panicum hallii]XP_025797415.1 2-oxoglutarate-Fe(II) type oxidoreductase hxnY-like isoform X1 [Panicum hallii]XP_025797416.1 2-oxoglutarate-Fe(II) type oxidoreductase hxnY-like isoform X1 [Panicum hallii]